VNSEQTTNKLKRDGGPLRSWVLGPGVLGRLEKTVQYDYLYSITSIRVQELSTGGRLVAGGGWCGSVVGSMTTVRS